MGAQNAVLVFIRDVHVQTVTKIRHLGCSECCSRAHSCHTCVDSYRYLTPQVLRMLFSCSFVMFMCRQLQRLDTLGAQNAVLVFILDMHVQTVIGITSTCCMKLAWGHFQRLQQENHRIEAHVKRVPEAIIEQTPEQRRLRRRLIREHLA